MRDDVFEWPYKARSSHVTELSLDHSTVSGASLPNLLIGIHSLRRFTYSAGGYWGQEQGQGHSHSYEPRLIIAALGLYAAHCLIYMHITGYRIGMGTEQDSQLDCDLKIFTQLKQLHTDYTLFNDVLRPCKSSCGEDSKACLCHPQRLVDRLPLSLVIVSLAGEMSTGMVQAILSGFREMKRELLPNLRILELEDVPTSDRSVIDICEDVGVVLNKIPRSEYY